MNKKNILIACVAIVVGLSGAFLFPKDKPAKPKHLAVIQKEILPLYPQLQPVYDEAMEDGVLLKSEAKMILDMAVELRNSGNK